MLAFSDFGLDVLLLSVCIVTINSRVHGHDSRVACLS